MPIQKLSESLVAKIAAGEVIERPASVVKELVENSIDAGSTSIQIVIEEGGRKGITIVDDGCGMSADQALLALERHATSKIASDDDLFRIRTLGFRGEALPSIAAVSWMTLESRGSTASGAAEATRIEIEGGKIVKQSVSSLPVGTRITVRNLFFNTPARLKFLKSKETEFSHIAQLVETLALANPGVGFQLTHQGRKELSSPPRSRPVDRVQDILGADIASLLLPFQGGRGGCEIFGFCAAHQVTHSSSKGIYLFVNGRAVRDRLLQHAVMAAYEHLLMKGRYPWVVAYLQVPPDFVDVNVHPTKNEVRFAQSQVVHELVRETIRKVLQTGGMNEKGRHIAGGSEDLSDVANGVSGYRPEGNRPAAGGMVRQDCHDDSGRGDPQEPEAMCLPFSPDLRIIGQVHSTYLICETPEKLILIDQHAAHERIGFEKLKRQFETGEIPRQPLLLPQSFDLSPSETELLKQYLPELISFGIEVDFFGGHTFLLRSLPVLLADTDCVVLLRDLVATLKDHEKLTPLTERVHEILERMACHAQVRAGDRLSLQEIEALLQEMEKTNFAYSCPHGRPALVQIPFGEVEKWFRRRL